VHNAIDTIDRSLKPLKEVLVIIDHHACDGFTPVPGLSGKCQLVELRG
jgi:hypothetical protein